MSNDEQNYRPLGPDEVIQEGDEYRQGQWRRPIPAEQEPKEGDYYACCPECGHLNDGHFTDCLKPIVDSLRAQLAESEKKRAEAEEEARRLINRIVENFVWLRDDSELVEAAQDYCAKHNTTSTMVGLVMLREKATTLLVERDQLRARAEKAERERDEAKERADRAVSSLERKGYREECSIPACNCGNKWSHGGRAEERLSEIANEVEHNGKVLLDAIVEMRDERDRLKAELAKCREALKPLDAIAERLATQDNRITAHPMFCVQIKVRDVGYDASYCDSKCWHDSSNCETVYDDDKDFQEPSGKEWDEFGYRDRWETVMVAFTEKGCEDYLSIDGHNVRHRAFRGEVRIYVESYNRCWEMIEIREALIRQAKAALEGGK